MGKEKTPKRHHHHHHNRSNNSYHRKIDTNPEILDLISRRNCPQMSAITNIVEYQDVSVGSYDFAKIAKYIPKELNLTHLVKIINPFTEASFELKRRLMYKGIEPENLFHGTKLKYVESICKLNFNWRYTGAERGHKYGKGVYFSSNISFSLHFCDHNTELQSVILAKVLIRQKGPGEKNLILPPRNCDTANNENNTTFVKFSDAEFCPAYLLYFTNNGPPVEKCHHHNVKKIRRFSRREN